VAIITGAGQGIGSGIALKFAEEGADVVVNYHKNNTMAEAVAEKIRRLACRALTIKADVSQKSDVERMVQTALDTFGKIDILVNNAGNSSMVAIADMDEETWDAVLDTHLKGMFLCCRYVLPHMIDQHSGNVISISSVGGQRGFGMGGHYCAAKHGIIGLNKAIAMEVADHNIRTNVVCPGTVWTDMMKGIAEFFGMEEDEAKEQFFQGHMIKDPELTPEDIGRAVLWLASDDSRCIHGNMITVDSGWTAQAP